MLMHEEQERHFTECTKHIVPFILEYTAKKKEEMENNKHYISQHCENDQKK